MSARSTTERPVGAHALAQALCQLARRRGIALPGRPTEEAVRERERYEQISVVRNKRITGETPHAL